MEYILLCLSSILVTALVRFFFGLKPNKKNSQFSLPPGPIAFPYLGSIPQMLMNKPIPRWIHKFMEDKNIEFACFRFGKVHVFVVTSPEIACEFFKREDANVCSRPVIMSADVTSGGYLSAALSPLGDQWRKMKRVLVSEVLSPVRHRWLEDKRIEEADHLVRYLYNQCHNSSEGRVVNVRVAAQHYCGNVLRKMMFNKRFFGKGAANGGPGAEEEEHVGTIFVILEYLYSFCISDYFPFLRGYDLDGHEKIIKKAVHIARKYQDPLVDERIRQWEDGSRNKEEDLLDVLICIKDSKGAPILSADEIKAQILEISVATLDNPSNCIEWALAEMLNQPELLQRATQELDNVVGKDRLVEESDLPKLNYIKACAKEAFRLHPITDFNIPHVAVTNTTVAGHTIPKGSHVLLSRPGLGRNPRVWIEPLKFVPERHLKSDGSNVVLTESELKILSFSTGRRGCPGVTLGSNMTTMLLARLLQGFTWSVPPAMQKIDLRESKGDLTLAKPLLAFAKPRLDHNIYPGS